MRELRRFLFTHQLLGGHVHVKVRAGTARHDERPDGTATGQVLGGTRALCGELVMRPEEWATFRELMEHGRATWGDLGIGGPPEDVEVEFYGD